MTASDAFREFEHAGWGDGARALAYHRHYGDVTRGCIPDLLAAAGVKAGERVLDVACGAGYVAAAARERGAEATGVDFSAAQVRLAGETYPGIRFVEGNAEALPFADGEFDAVLNAFGLPHVADADRVTAEALRMLRPGGRFAYASWCAADRCIAFAMVYDAIRAHGTLDVGLPPGPNFFGYGDPANARDLLGRAGFTDVTTRESPLAFRAPSLDAVYEAVATGTVRASAVLNRQSAEALPRIKAHLRECVAAFKDNGGFAVPAPALVASGMKPR
jgi:SAM-dependent methyltransferase